MRTSIRERIRKLGQHDFVAAAIEEQADLSAFRERPTPLVLAGVTAICLSFLLGWPAVTALGFLAVKFHNPWIAALGGPLTYGLSHLVFLLGMYLSGALYSMIFLRWLTRVTMERLLAWADQGRGALTKPE
ncbi:hypothetical protein [Desulfogranum mediterraneum]|uniref:hypothetical protein n=1 Tax=Desulfogranum mediterraneum TaxID=160661 RepID=UPI0003FDFD82|nr:hypothetical protein [Desulfogranum mediterraneum]